MRVGGWARRGEKKEEGRVGGVVARLGRTRGNEQPFGCFVVVNRSGSSFSFHSSFVVVPRDR